MTVGSTGARPFCEIITSIRYLGIHAMTLPSIFLAGVLVRVHRPGLRRIRNPTHRRLLPDLRKQGSLGEPVLRRQANSMFFWNKQLHKLHASPQRYITIGISLFVGLLNTLSECRQRSSSAPSPRCSHQSLIQSLERKPNYKTFRLSSTASAFTDSWRPSLRLAYSCPDFSKVESYQ